MHSKLGLEYVAFTEGVQAGFLKVYLSPVWSILLTHPQAWSDREYVYKTPAER